jgi:hypothetical protein
MKEVDEQKLTIKNARWDNFFYDFVFWEFSRHKSNINNNLKWQVKKPKEINFNKYGRVIH